jgi:hypothetical protein
MIETFILVVIMYLLTLLLSMCFIKHDEPNLSWKESFNELQDIPVIFVPILNTVIMVAYVIVNIIVKCKSDL